MFSKLFIDRLEPLAQVYHRIVLPREQRVHAQAGRRGKLFEALALDLVRDEYLALLFGKLIQSSIELFKQHIPGIDRLRPGIGRREQVLEQQRLSIFRTTTGSFPSASGLFLRKRSVIRFRATRKSHALTLLDRLHHPVRFHELVEDLL